MPKTPDIMDAIRADITRQLEARNALVEETLAAFLLKTPVDQWRRIVLVYEPLSLREDQEFTVHIELRDPEDMPPVLPPGWSTMSLGVLDPLVGQYVTIFYEESANIDPHADEPMDGAEGIISMICWSDEGPYILLDWGWGIALKHVYDIRPGRHRAPR